MLEISKAVIKKDKNYLLIKRVDYSASFPGLWDFPGGKFDLGETPEQAVARETMEEVSLEINPGDEVKNAEYHDERYDLLFHYFIPEVFFGELKLSSDHTDFKWVAREEIGELELSPSVELFFRNID